LAQYGCSPHINENSRFGKGRVNVVDWDWVEGICRVTADINNHSQPPVLARCNDLITGHEGRDWRIEIYAIDKNVNVKNLREWATFRCFIQVPLEDIIPGDVINQ